MGLITMMMMMVVVMMMTMMVALVESQQNIQPDSNGVGMEYCESEQFNPSCAENEVILIQRALFGRMQKGRCIKGQYGMMGMCNRDVRDTLDAECSGRRQCDVSVVKVMPNDFQSCAGELRGYLEVAYTCVRVAHASPEYCRSSGILQLTVGPPVNYLSSLVSEETKCGSYETPWWLQAKTGQKIQLTLFDFQNTSPGTCVVYAVVKEETILSSSAQPGSVTICGGRSREEVVFISKTSRIEIRLSAKQQDKPPKNFLIKYEAIGCPDPATPTHGWVRREDDRVLMGCNATGTEPRWRLQCDNQQWTGSYSNCTNTGGVASSSSSNGGQYSISSLSVLIILGIACTVGLVILLFGLLYIRRKRQRNLGRPSMMPATLQHDLQQDYKVANYQPHQMHHISKSSEHLDSYQSTENNYYRTWQLQRHGNLQQSQGQIQGQGHLPYPGYGQMPVQYYGPTVDERTGTGSAGFVTYNSDNKSRYSEHIYESPKFERKEIIPPGYKGTDAVPTEYFELDPDSPTANTTAK